MIRFNRLKLGQDFPIRGQRRSAVLFFVVFSNVVVGLITSQECNFTIIQYDHCKYVIPCRAIDSKSL